MNTFAAIMLGQYLYQIIVCEDLISQVHLEVPITEISIFKMKIKILFS